MIEWAEKQVAKGRLGGLGFSFHDELDVFKEIVDSYDIGRLAKYNTIIWTRNIRLEKPD